MPLWGASTSDESKPKNLTAEEKSRVFADTRGWVITRADGKEEVLVAIRNLSGGVVAADDVKLEGATISQVFFTDATVEADTLSTVRVVWNEKVTATTTGTLIVRDLTNSANITATRVGATGTNYVDFQFRAPVDPAALAVQAQTITMGINDVGSTDITSDLTIASGDVVAIAAGPAGNTSTLVTTTNTPATITSAYFADDSFSTGVTNAAVVVLWSEDVTATTTGTMTVMRSTATSNVALTATRYGPANGSSVTFRFTAPSTTGVTLSITSQTISMGIVNADTTATTADLTIALADVANAVGGTTTSVVTTV